MSRSVFTRRFLKDLLGDEQEITLGNYVIVRMADGSASLRDMETHLIDKECIKNNRDFAPLKKRQEEVKKNQDLIKKSDRTKLTKETSARLARLFRKSL